MIIDAVLYNGEQECLDIRRSELDAVIDYRVIVIGDTDFRGQHRPLPTVRNKTFRETIWIHHVVGNTTWERETNQRNALISAIVSLQKVSLTDNVLIADIDEIPRASVLQEAIRQLGVSTSTLTINLMPLILNLYYYRLNLRVDHVTPHQPVVTTVGLATSLTGQGCRQQGTSLEGIKDAGWHFSYLGDVLTAKRKIQQFSHIEYDTPEFTSDGHIQRCMNDGVDLFDRGYQIYEVSLDNAPRCVRNNREEWEHLIWQKA